MFFFDIFNDFLDFQDFQDFHEKCDTKIMVLHSFSASMLYQELILKQSDVSYRSRKFNISLNELRDSEIFEFPWRKLIKMFDVNSEQILPPVELLLRWNTYSTIISPD